QVSNERAVENERLVSMLGYLEKEKTDSIGKLLPTVVRKRGNSPISSRTVIYLNKLAPSVGRLILSTKND
ncbi:hypothetical protein Tco_0376214, partial [Tanacetum coccineum]